PPRQPGIVASRTLDSLFSGSGQGVLAKERCETAASRRSDPDLEPLHLLVEGRGLQSEDLGRLLLDPPGLAQRRLDQLPLVPGDGAIEVRSLREARGPRGRGARQ